MTAGEMISDFMHAFHFLRPQWLLALPLLWGLVFWLARRQRRLQDWAALIVGILTWGASAAAVCFALFGL